MENFEKQFNQLNSLETKKESENILLEGPELVSPEEERKQEGEISFSFSSNTRRYYLGHKDGKPFFMVEYFDSLPDELNKEEKEKFTKETRKQGEVEKTIYVLKHGEVPESKDKIDSSYNKKYRIAQSRDFERMVINNFVADDRNKQIMSEILTKCPELNHEEISQIVERTFEIFRRQDHEALQVFSNNFPKEVVSKVMAEIRERMLPKPQEIETAQLAEVLKEKKVLFYTGAGISMASGVYNMDQLEKSLQSI